MTICQLFLHDLSSGDAEEASDETEPMMQSAFAGSRRPYLGQIKEDKLARKLAEAARL
jgi:hypothetical protein